MSNTSANSNASWEPVAEPAIVGYVATIAGLVVRLGGEVTIPIREFVEAGELELSYWYDEANFAYKISAQRRLIATEGEAIK